MTLPYALLHLAFLASLSSAAQPSAPSPIPAPLRSLPWGQLNFLHTTDIHGWWGGHLQEPSYAADWGDYISFASHLHAHADATGTDLLLIDCGDRIEGNAIYDSSKPRGKFTYEIAKEAPIDLISSGNHELYKQESSEGEFYHTVPDFKGRYLASNLDIYNPETGELEPLAPRFKKFATKNLGIRILAFGFLFDFTGNANNTVIHRVEDTVQEDWFKEAIKDEDIDLIIVFGHVDVRSPEYQILFRTIRTARPDTPIQFFGGHTHIRDYAIYDDKSVALESGRYMETVGFQSISGLRTPKSLQAEHVKFERRYIDKNLYSLQHHSNKTSEDFPTPHGQKVSAQIDVARRSLHLNEIYGCAPQDLWVNRRPYPHQESIFSWLVDEVLPDTISQSRRSQAGKKSLVIINTGGIRFDIFKGTYTKDTTFLVSPFTSGLRYIKDVPYSAARRVLRLLNNEGPILTAMKEERAHIESPEMTASHFRPEMPTTIHTYGQALDRYSRAHSEALLRLRGQGARLGTAQQPLSPSNNGHKEEKFIIPGYTTVDDAGTDGDDTIHAPISFYEVPNCVQATVNLPKPQHYKLKLHEAPLPADADVQTVDLVYNEFVQKWILMALQYLGEKVAEEDTQRYFEDERRTSSFTELMTEWVKENWGKGVVVGDDGERMCPT